MAGHDQSTIPLRFAAGTIVRNRKSEILMSIMPQCESIGDKFFVERAGDHRMVFDASSVCAASAHRVRRTANCEDASSHNVRAYSNGKRSRRVENPTHADHGARDGRAVHRRVFSVGYYEGAEGNYDFTHPDYVIDHARNQGVTVIARLGMVPQWAREKNTTDTYLDEKHYADFAKYVGKFVERYRGKIKYVIIWNEPNLSLEWGYRQVDPRGYVAMLREAYRAAKAANPEIQVLAGALAPTLEPDSSDLAMNDLIYLQKLYDAGFANYYDILSVHSYGLSFPPDDPPALDA